MLHAAQRLVAGRQPLGCLSRRLMMRSRPSTAANSLITSNSEQSFCSSSDREKQIEAELGGAQPASTAPLITKHRKEVMINRSGLLPTRMSHAKDDRPPLEGLARELEQMIMLSGPITVAEYMMYALQHPTHGYYMRQEDKIGKGGDFITAPEISQAFGEMIGIWCVASWKEMDCPQKVRLVELGPGKGTLMTDVLRAATSFPDFRKALTLHMVETSSDLRALQVEALGATMKAASSSSSSSAPKAGEAGHAPQSKGDAMQLSGGGEVFWHSKLDEVPKGQPTLVIGQEFLDALPVHQFQYTAKGWRERLVDINTPCDGSVEQRPGETDPSAQKAGGADEQQHKQEKEEQEEEEEEEEPDFRFVISANETVAVKAFLTKQDTQDKKLVMGGLGAGSSRREARRTGAGAGGSRPGPRGEKVGDRLEVSGESISLIRDVAQRVAEDGGGALFVDYGEAHALDDSLRCFKGHQEVPVLSAPGEADMTADVNFGLLRRIVDKVEGARPYGPVGQGQFLREMGIGARLTALAEQPSVTTEQAEAMLEGYVRLVDPAQMGTRYKVLGITEAKNKMPPPGFMSEIDLDVRKD